MKTIFITGINKGLGKELLNQFAKGDYFVYGLLRNEQEYKQLNTCIPGNVELILADISKDECISIIKDSVKDNPIHLLINNAGIGGVASNLEKVDPDELNNLFNINCVGILRVTKALKENLLSTKDGTVINITSRLGSIARQGNGTYKDLTVSYSYRISKAAQNMLTNCLRAEFQKKIKFIPLHPGSLKTAIAQPTANIEPSASAKMIIDNWEQNKLKEVNGIIELPDTIIEW